MPATNNKEAPEVDRPLVASLLQSTKPPLALNTPDCHLKRSTAQSVISKLLNLCVLANILGAVYVFGELTTGVDVLGKIGLSSSKLAQWKY